MEILDNREQRALFQTELLDKYRNKTLIVIKANYPSSNKNNLMTSYLTTKFFFVIKNKLNLIEYYVTSNSEGLIYYLILDNSADFAKREAIKLEETKLGRLVDIDVLSALGQLSRASLNINPRKCFLCNDNAKNCSRSQRHNIEEIITYFNNIVIEDIFNKDLLYSNLVLYGLINELNKPYNFGCVGINYQGNHQDMNMKTFISSIEILMNEFKYLSKVDMTSFSELRKFGKKIEIEMFKVTNGVNTHKGAIFSLLLILAGLSNADEYCDVVKKIKKLSYNILDDFEDDKIDNSFGKGLYKEKKIRGIRGYAYDGYEIIFNDFEPFYARTKDVIKTFLNIISKLEDTTIIKRGDYHTLKELQALAKIELTNLDYKNIDKFCNKYNLSCGGSADLLACTYIVNLVKDNFKKIH